MNKAIENFIKQEIKRFRDPDEKFTTIGCNVKESEKQVLNMIAQKMGHKSISSLLRAFCDNLLTNKNFVLDLIKQAKPKTK